MLFWCNTAILGFVSAEHIVGRLPPVTPRELQARQHVEHRLRGGVPNADQSMFGDADSCASELARAGVNAWSLQTRACTGSYSLPPEQFRTATGKRANERFPGWVVLKSVLTAQQFARSVELVEASQGWLRASIRIDGCYSDWPFVARCKVTGSW